MALLSGFASISSPWQNFSTRPRLVTETDIMRKETGLSATQDMLSAKQSRLRALERKLADRPSESYFQKALGTIRPNADMHELKTLGASLSFALMLFVLKKYTRIERATNPIITESEDADDNTT